MANSSTHAERLRAGARAMRAVVGDDAWAIPMIADALDADAARLERGESVDDLVEALALADSFTETDR